MIISFDYSLTSPCMCISSSANWADAKLWYLTDKKKYAGTFANGKIIGHPHQDWSTPEQRHNQISNYFIGILERYPSNVRVYIEDYSMGSKGRVFHIGENTGLLKHKLWLRGHPITLLAPTVIKKFATGKGNAKKPDMHEAFVKQTGFNMSQFGSVGTNPSSDIIDSWFIMSYAFIGVDKANS
jgi:Holliday junction resolvasome RuvABC endonuclease subunit